MNRVPLSMQVAQTVQSMREVLLERSRQAAQVMADEAYRDVRAAWPGVDRSVHPYATGRSKAAWAKGDTKYDHLEHVWITLLQNDARDPRGREYSHYTAVGATRQGIKMARSWKVRRGEESYHDDALALTWLRVEPVVRRIVAEQVDRV